MQKTIDFAKPERETAVRERMLESVECPKAVFSLMRGLYRIAGGFDASRVACSVLELMESCRYSRRTVQRAIREAEELNLITVERTNYKRSTFTLNWKYVFDTCTLDRGAIVAQGGRNSCAPIKDNLNINNKLYVNDKNCAPMKSGSLYGGWGIELTSKGLKNPGYIQKRYEYALAKAWFDDTPVNRLGFFACAVQATTKGTKAKGGFARLFTHLVKNRAWTKEKMLCDASDQKAQEMIKRLAGKVRPKADYFAEEAEFQDAKKINTSKLLEKYGVKK